MPKNIVIFSDGTGQRGGLLFDERRSNIYKLYRATRCGPDSSVNPTEQLTFYDPGIGTLPAGIGLLAAAWHWARNLVSQATGLGLTKNIIDCYAAIIRLWEPGDRIFLFGFSRGAYTVRCLGGVIGMCGIPTVEAHKPLQRDDKTTRRIARIGVKQVYQHTSSIKLAEATERQKAFLAQRAALARRFRQTYGCDRNDSANEYPYFIGVFDTVASLANPAALVGFAGAAIVSVVILSAILSLLTLSFWTWVIALLAVATICALIGYMRTHLKVAFGLQEYSWWKTFHLTEFRMKFYDTDLNKNVGYARHAISIDENRASFQRVRWGTPREWRDTGEGNPIWFEQFWFAGNHSDIGGSYPENESRLSDITMQWMVEQARAVGLKADDSVLHLYPSAAGIQHDECKSSVFRFAGKRDRDPPHDAPLHPSVLERFRLPSILQYDETKPYRPRCLRDHQSVAQYY